jgi:prophage regulatory protein
MSKTIARVLDLPSTGFLRANQIIGNPKKGIPALLPISRSTFWASVREGRFSPGVLLGPRTRAWRVEEVRSWIANVGTESTDTVGV